MNMQQNYPMQNMMPPEMAYQNFYGGVGTGFDAGIVPAGYGMPVVPPGYPMVPQGDIKRPTGGMVAQGMKVNPYLSPSGNYRKPRQDEIIKELQIFKGLQATGRAVRVSDVNLRIRHCCVAKPYFHVLGAEKYRVVLPSTEIEVIYYVHDVCKTLIVVGDTLSE